MAGNFSGPGHRIVSGETPEVGLRVLTNDYKWGSIVQLGHGLYNSLTGQYDGPETVPCGWYCEAWHHIHLDGTPDGTSTIYNCDRLTTQQPRTGNSIDVTWQVPPITTGGEVTLDSLTVSLT